MQCHVKIFAIKKLKAIGSKYADSIITFKIADEH